MEILEIKMDHFGKFDGQTMQFHPGINVVYGDNETGKSTMRSFIRAMFYGLERSRGRASKTDEYTLRKPWENGNYFAGGMRFQSGGKIYALERSFSGLDKYTRLICETDGRELDPDSLSILLGGMDAAAFDNTVFFGRTDAGTDEELAAAVVNEMISANPGGEKIDAAGALAELRAQKKQLEKEKKQRLTEKVERLQEISTRIACAQVETEQLAKEERALRENLKEQEAKAAEIPEEPEAEDMESEESSQNGVWKIGKIAMALIAVAALAAGLLFTQWQVRAGAAAVILLSCVGVRFFGMRDERQKDGERAKKERLREARIRNEYERMQRKKNRWQQLKPQYEKIRMNIEWTQDARREKQRQMQELLEERERAREGDGQEQQEEQKLLAVTLAIDTLEEAVAEVYRDYVKQLDAAASEILREITEGKYTGVFLDEKFEVRVRTAEKFLSVWQVSRGAMEQIYFSLRMACAQFLNREDPLPLILDDAFLTYDDARLERTLRWLGKCGRQTILFTCHRREQEILQRISR